MGKTYVVQPGDCMSSIADRFGFAPATIWNDAANEALRAKRPDPNMLMPGDEVYVRDRVQKSVAAATGRVHRFRRIGVPARLRLQVVVRGVVYANEPYTLTAGGKVQSGTTDGNGVLTAFVPPGAASAELVIGAEPLRIRIALGRLPPGDDVGGIQSRLNNLGYRCGAPDGTLNAATVRQLRRFQLANGLEVTGAIDDATREKLVALHDRITEETGT